MIAYTTKFHNNNNNIPKASKKELFELYLQDRAERIWG